MTPNRPSLKKTLAPLVDAYIELYKERPPYTGAEGELRFSEIQNRYCWVFGQMCDLVSGEPDTAWRAILLILEDAHDQSVLDTLAAGPIESLIESHGQDFIGRIEEQAEKDVKFKKLLWGVWERGEKEVWDRVKEARRFGPGSKAWQPIEFSEKDRDELAVAFIREVTETEPHRSAWTAWTGWNDALAPEDIPSAIKFEDLAREQPEHAWNTILEVVKRTDDKKVLEELRERPLGDLLFYHEQEYSKKLIEMAKADERFWYFVQG